MNISAINFKSAYVSKDAKLVLDKKQKDAIYKYGYNQPYKHIEASLLYNENNSPNCILLRISDKKTTKEQGRTLIKLNAQPKTITSKLKRLMKSIIHN